jgi:hypothetical protein
VKLKKLLFASVLALMVSAGAFAGDVLAMSLNFHDDNGNVTPACDFPAGVMMKKRITFSNKTLKGFAYPLTIELDRVQEVDLAFKVRGEGRFVVSVNPEIWEKGKGVVSKMKVKCTEFVLNGVPGKKIPFTFEKWTAIGEVNVKDGDVVTIKAAFEKVE